MLRKGAITVAMATFLLSAVVIHQAEGGKLKKLIAASVIAGALKPRFVPLPIPIPFKLKIPKGDKIVPYPVYPQEMHYGGGGGGYGGGGFGGGGYGGGGGGGGYGGGNDWW